MLEMKRILKSVVLVVCACLVSFGAQSQTYELQIDSIVGIPDTVYNGQEVTFYMIVSMNSPLFYQGDVFVELEYGSQFYQVDTSINANGFLNPNAPNTISATYIFSTDNYLNIGDNVVVVWPRIGDGVNPPQTVVNPKTVAVTLIEPTGIEELSRNGKSVFYPNPAQSAIHFVDELKSEVKQISILDAFGRLLHKSCVTTQMDVSSLPTGVYFIQVETKEGNLVSDKLLISR